MRWSVTPSGLLMLAGALLLAAGAFTNERLMPYGIMLVGLAGLSTERKLIRDQRWIWSLRAAGAVVLGIGLVQLL